MYIQVQRPPNGKWFYWNGIAFPLLSGLRYRPDGPDKAHPDRLFITDRQDRFWFYFETGYCGPPDSACGAPGFDTVDVIRHGRRLRLHYPLQNPRHSAATGYFRIERMENGVDNLVCAGSLSISPAGSYWDSLLRLPEACVLLERITGQGGEGGDAAP